MGPNNPYCYVTQTQPETDYDAQSDFSPIRIGRSMSPASAVRRNPQQLSLSNEEEPPQPRRHQQGNAGLGQTNIANVVNATAPAWQHGKVTSYILCRYITMLITNVKCISLDQI